MCEVKGGCTCGNESCCMDDDFDLNRVDVKSEDNGRKVYYIETGDLPDDKAEAFIDNLMQKFKAKA